MKVLVTGGAGYIGSHAVRLLRIAGHDVVVLDRLLSERHRKAVGAAAPLIRCDLADRETIVAALRDHQIELVMHFAALAYVGESVNDPLKYYQNNVGGTVSLLQAMDAAGVKRMVFSSTCATYGLPKAIPITENTPQRPVNPYGHSKHTVEQILCDSAVAHGLGYVALRYFNVAGASEDGSLGEDHDPETHLIPLALMAACGRREGLTVFGDDYDTPDGTCIRDFVHVDDLCRAHLAAMEAIESGRGQYFNVGIGKGFSVRQVIAATEKVTGMTISTSDGPRRAGDPPQLVADASKIRGELGWKPKFTSLEAIIKTAWVWLKDHPRGYA